MTRSAVALTLGPLLLALAACVDMPPPQTAAAPPAPAPQITAVVPPPPPPAVTPALPVPPPPPADERLVVEFPSGLGGISDEVGAQLDKAARLYRDGHPTMMTVTGHSDPSGDQYTNLLLSAKRAAAVKQGLVDRGIPEERLEMLAVGSANPVVPSPPDAPENRSAVVTWR